MSSYLPGVPVCEQTENWVPDPGFDGGVGEDTDWPHLGECTFQADQPGHNSDPSALMFAQVRDDDCRLFTPIDEISVEPASYYDYSAWVKTWLLQGDAYLRIVFYRWRESPPGWERVPPFAYTNAVTDTQEVWVKVTGSVQAPPGAEYASVEAVLPESSEGSVWVDDVVFDLATCLDISKRDHPDPVAPGQILTYTIVYSSTGCERATDVQIIETYDDYVDPIITRTQPLPDKSDNIWEVAELLPGDGGVITPVVRVEGDVGSRSSLVNWCEIDSDEMVQSIRDYITTTISDTVDGCAVVLLPPEAEQTARPGEVANYSLVLYNGGFHDGQAVLTATSSRGWEVGIVPEEWQHTMPSKSSSPLTVTLAVPLDAADGITDVTLITATLVCGPPCNETVTETAVVTTRIGVSPATVVISGPTAGRPEILYTFSAAVNPPTATQPIIYAWWPPPASGQGSAVVTYTWSTTGVKNITVTATNAGGAASDTHVITIAASTPHVYLPLIMRYWPPIPVAVPELYVDNADIYGDYDVCWHATARTTFYVLEVDTDEDFFPPTAVYTVTDTTTDPYCHHYHLSGSDPVWHYYRAKACNSWGCGIESSAMGAWWEHEPNHPCSSANNSLSSGKEHHGLPNDGEDWFRIVPSTSGQIHVTLEDHTGGGVQLQLYRRCNEPLHRATRPPYEVTYTVGDVGDGDWYSICVKADSGYNQHTPYTLRVIFP